MKIHLSVYELWAWRISIIGLIIFAVFNSAEDRHQKELIFKLTDLNVSNYELMEKLVKTDSILIDAVDMLIAE